MESYLLTAGLVTTVVVSSAKLPRPTEFSAATRKKYSLPSYSLPVQ